MFITLETDYAVRITSVLCRKGVKTDAKSISEEAAVTLRFTLKILRKLVGAGLVKSFKGTRGGYIIDKKPEDITLRMVIEAIEGPYYFSRCRKAFAEVSDLVRNKLDEYNFYDLINADNKEKEAVQ